MPVKPKANCREKDSRRQRNDCHRRGNEAPTEHETRCENEQAINQPFVLAQIRSPKRAIALTAWRESVVSRLLNHPKIRAVSHLENRSHQNRERQNASADKRQIAQAFDLRGDHRADAETEREKGENRFDNRRDKLGFPESQINARVSLPDRQSVGQIDFGKRQIHY